MGEQLVIPGAGPLPVVPAKRRKMPRQKPGESRQNYGTPWGFIRIVEAMWGRIEVDLAAEAHNAKAAEYITKEDNSLAQPWMDLFFGNCWLNPEFAHIRPWAKKCAEEAKKLRPNQYIFLLTPASVGSAWYWDYVHYNALILPLQPRLTFEGEKDPYVKDLILSVYGAPSGFERWTWEEPKPRGGRNKKSGG